MSANLIRWERANDVAAQAVDLLCSLGFLGLHPSRQRELWQRALDLDRQLNPHRPRTIVWTAEDGDVDPPRREDGTALPTVEFVGAAEPAGAETHDA